ncbi:DUF1840 domain-containing protein [Marinomonas ostreistagni]|uniref:DUF1840 domain-containing protein n=1 Tax=Marinomonas ostreistagni TaxID=359209 RepID=UPI001951F7F3|nr:DUF1840 domain-containing protein [Marinomonas ostreistagni]MBM6551472.1 DUF1840 domain-containing protein [Marinomonas ostreistagni]
MTFRSDAHANITMFGSVGMQLVNMMGYGDSRSGAIQADDIPEVLQRLQSALAQQKANAQPEQEPEDEDGEPAEQPVSIANRALPLIDMLKAASREECAIMWEGK